MDRSNPKLVSQRGSSDPQGLATQQGSVTQKGLRSYKDGNAYTFKVNSAAKDVDIARAIEKTFKVKVTGVRTVRDGGKMKYAGKVKKFREVVAKTPWKRAVVTLAQGDSIELIETAGEEREPSLTMSTHTPEQLAAMADYHRARRGFSTDVELAEVLGVRRHRVASWKAGTGTPDREHARLLSYLAIVVGELEGFLDPDVIPDWLLSEQFRLGDKTPIEALQDGRLAEVLYAANATEHGAYT